MLTDDALKAMIESQLPDASVTISGDGCQQQALVVSPHFAGLSRLERQRTVMQTVADAIADGSLHALQVKAVTPDEC